jgi:hypothetical protein
MGSGNRSKDSSRGGTSDTKLSAEQAKILKNREAMYQQYFFPAMLDELRSTEGPGQTARLAQSGLANVNKAYQGAERDVSRSLAQRELTGGFQGTALAGLQTARAEAVAGTVNDAYLQNKQLRHGLIGMALQASPQPTTAAPLHQKQRSKGSTLGMSILGG